MVVKFHHRGETRSLPAQPATAASVSSVFTSLSKVCLFKAGSSGLHFNTYKFRMSLVKLATT